MKVLAYIHAYVGTGRNAGAELTIHEMLYSLRAAGHDVTVLLSERIEPNSPFVIDGVKVQPYSSRKDPNLWIPQSDVVISHLGCAERAALICKQTGKKMVHLVHNTHPETWNSIGTYSDLTVYNTDWVRALSPVKGNDMVMHPAVRPEFYQTTKGKSVMMINLTKAKGAELFYEMARRFPNVPFLGVRGGYGDQIIEDLPNVTIISNQQDVRKAYEQAKVVLMPSAYESYGRVAVEAAASGIPAIVARTPGLLEAMGPTGYYADAPSTDMPGNYSDDPWTEAHFSEWEAQLKKVLSPAGYSKASKVALERSAATWKDTKTELDEFIQRTEELVYGNRNRRRG